MKRAPVLIGLAFACASFAAAAAPQTVPALPVSLASAPPVLELPPALRTAPALASLPAPPAPGTPVADDTVAPAPSDSRSDVEVPEREDAAPELETPDPDDDADVVEVEEAPERDDDIDVADIDEPSEPDLAEVAEAAAAEAQAIAVIAALQEPPAPPAAPAPAPAPAPAAPAAPPVAPRPPRPPRVITWTKGSYLGIGVQEITAERSRELKLPEERGVEVTTVGDDSPAAKAGLREGDVVLEYNGQRVEGVEQFVRMVRETPAGRAVKLLVNRGGAARTLTATISDQRPDLRMEWFRGPNIEGLNRDLQRQLGPDSKFQRDMQKLQDELGQMQFEMPDVPQPEMVWKTNLLGIEAEAIDSQLAEFFGVKQGVLVRSVEKNSVAEKAGLKAGDVITKVADTEVSKPGDVTRILRKLAGKPVAVLAIRSRKHVSFNVTVEAKPANARTIERRRIHVEPHQFVAPQHFVRGRLVSTEARTF